MCVCVCVCVCVCKSIVTKNLNTGEGGEKQNLLKKKKSHKNLEEGSQMKKSAKLLMPQGQGWNELCTTQDNQAISV